MDSSMDDKTKRKLKFMSYQEKLEAIELIGKGKSQRKIAKELGIGRTTLYNALKNREKIVEASKKFPEGTNRRRTSTIKHPQIESAVLSYISEARENGEKLTGSAIQSIALETAAKLRIQDFSGSNGWLFSFFKRNNISIKDLNENTEDRKKKSEDENEIFEETYNDEINDDDNDEDDDNKEEEFIYSETIENEEFGSAVNWKDWCRTCGNIETLPEVEQDILDIIVKLLNLTFEDDIKICPICHQSLQIISDMINRSKFVENMFIELEEYSKDNFVSHDDIIRIRDRYDMKNDDQMEEEVMKTEEISENLDDEIVYEEEWNDEIEEPENQPKIPEEVLEDLKPSKKLPEEDLFTYTCHICNENFTRMCFLSNHTRKSHNCLPQVACTCGRLLATWDSLMAHKRKHSTEPRDWTCDLCNASFITKNGLTIHIKFKHQTQQQLHLCTICGKEFKDSYTLRTHERTHLPDSERYIYECKICSKKFTQRGSLKIHISTVHEGQKSIMCHLCSKNFSSNHYLKIHILTHSIENVRCDVCDSVFKNRVSLQNHKKKIHKPRESLNFPCTICDRRFHNRNHLERHMPAHTGEKNFKCTYENCENAFKWEKDLRNHIARHSGERRHKCLWCERMFIDSGNMRKHKIRYHAEQLAEFEMKYGKRRRLKDLILDSEDTQ